MKPWREQIVESLHEQLTLLGTKLIELIPRLIATVLILLLFWAIARFVRWITNRFVRRFGDQTQRSLVSYVSYYTVWLIGTGAALGTLGVNVGTLVTALGLTSVALGFALKEVLSNLVSGLLILVSRSFEIGDEIIVGETEGAVERIEVRVTHIRTYDGRLVLVPNAEVFTSRVVNNTASPLRRASVIVHLDYDQNRTLAQQVILDAVRSTERVARNPPPSIRMLELAMGYLVLDVRFWTEARRADFVETSCNVRSNLLDALQSAGLRMPNPGVRILVPGDASPWRDALGLKLDARDSAS